MKKLIFAVLAVVFCLSLSVSAQQGKKVPAPAGGAILVPSECDATPGNLVANCGFETGDFTSWTQSGDLSFTDVDPDCAHSGDFGLCAGPVDGLSSRR
jgi:hypothetical protein